MNIYRIFHNCSVLKNIINLTSDNLFSNTESCKFDEILNNCMMTTDFNQIYQIYEPYKRTISKESIMTIVGNLHI